MKFIITMHKASPTHKWLEIAIGERTLVIRAHNSKPYLQQEPLSYSLGLDPDFTNRFCQEVF